VIKIKASSIRFGQNQNLASPTAFVLLRLCPIALPRVDEAHPDLSLLGERSTII